MTGQAPGKALLIVSGCLKLLVKVSDEVCLRIEL